MKAKAVGKIRYVLSVRCTGGGLKFGYSTREAAERAQFELAMDINNGLKVCRVHPDEGLMPGFISTDKFIDSLITTEEEVK